MNVNLIMTMCSGNAMAKIVVVHWPVNFEHRLMYNQASLNRHVCLLVTSATGDYMVAHRRRPC